MSLNNTLIPWALNPDGTPGYTWNPITGCLNHVNGMCKGGNFPCYAHRLAHGRLKERYLANDKIAISLVNPVSDPVQSLRSALKISEVSPDPFFPRFWPERLFQAWDIKGRQKSKGVFVCDMSDLFGIGIPEKWTGDVLDIIRFNKSHRFYLLTKQPQNLIKFSPFPDNCWVGVTVCNDKMLDVAVDKLEDIQATHKFFSFEPLNERLTLSLDYALYYSGVSWLIIGAQSKPTVMPKIEWVREIVQAADKAGIPVFLKDSLKPLILKEEKLPIWAMKVFERGKVFNLRQEMPKQKK